MKDKINEYFNQDEEKYVSVAVNEVGDGIVIKVEKKDDGNNSIKGK